jgi:hypothetical protein
MLLKYLYIFLCISLMLGCTDSSSDLEISTINLSVDKEVVIVGQDTFTLTAEVLDNVFSPIEGLDLDYYVDDILLRGNQFIPEEEGKYVLSARYKDIRSKIRNVSAISLTENIEEFQLKYNGNVFLTTSDWSVSGPFSYIVRKESKLYEA